MRYELKSARYLARELLTLVLREGDAAVDATMGNGHDTLFLCECVGPAGRVYAFDVQEEAVGATGALLRAEGREGTARLFLCGHERMDLHVPEKVQAVMFNLGWLPGGSHDVTTRWETTREAVTKALDLLLPGGVLTVCAYPGHAEGARERDELTALLAALPAREFNVLGQRFLNGAENAPECFAVQRLR